ncbi:hypothetical protein BDZ45DRAFT_742688 [Acephala macrosclerotiorum]|nr:hypothetical protein BDZ45DRAFT_742688 [Acephala macrosclerotiorum]
MQFFASLNAALAILTPSLAMIIPNHGHSSSLDLHEKQRSRQQQATMVSDPECTTTCDKATGICRVKCTEIFPISDEVDFEIKNTGGPYKIQKHRGKNSDKLKTMSEPECHLDCNWDKTSCVSICYGGNTGGTMTTVQSPEI